MGITVHSLYCDFWQCNELKDDNSGGNGEDSDIVPEQESGSNNNQAVYRNTPPAAEGPVRHRNPMSIKVCTFHACM